jgi:hypothetical protein
MLRSAVATAAELQGQGKDHHRVKFNFYPDPRISNAVSLRLFGSEHAKTGAFSRVLAHDVLLDESESWEYFAETLGRRTVAVAQFEAAHHSLINRP